MAVRYQIVIAEKGAMPKGYKRMYPAWAKGAWRAVAEHWHKVYRPLHFTEAAFSRYNIYKRRAAYTTKKKGHSKPLFDSGDSLRQSEKQDIRGTSSGASIYMRVPKLNYFGSYRPIKGTGGVTVVKWMGPRMRMREELEFVNSEETRYLGVVAANHFAKMINATNTETRKRIA
jgi:hypothetical protein